MRSPRVYGDIDRMWFLEAAKAERKRLSRRRNRKSKASQKRKRSKQKRSRASAHNRRFRGDTINEWQEARNTLEDAMAVDLGYLGALNPRTVELKRALGRVRETMDDDTRQELLNNIVTEVEIEKQELFLLRQNKPANDDAQGVSTFLSAALQLQEKVSHLKDLQLLLSTDLQVIRIAIPDYFPPGAGEE